MIVGVQFVLVDCIVLWLLEQYATNVIAMKQARERIRQIKFK
jgi:hypothetical protein